MAYSEDEENKIFEKICEEISNGKSTRKAIKENNISSQTFYKWVDNCEIKAKQYARACEERAEALLDEMIDIVDDSSNDTCKIEIAEGVEVEKTNYEVIQRSRLRYDARKWLISKLNPKKYGDKLQQEITGETKVSISFED